MRIKVVTGDILKIRITNEDGEYLDNYEENKLFEFLQARQLNRVTAPKEVSLHTLFRA